MKIIAGRFVLWGKGLAVILLALGFFAPLDFGADLPVWHQTLDLAHFFIFALVAWWLVVYLRQRGSRSPYLMTFLISTAVMIAIECLQPLVGRSGSLDDVYKGVLGCLLGLAWRRWPYADLTRAGQLGLLIATLLGTVFVSADAARQWWAVYWRSSHFPALAEFDDCAAMPLWLPYGEFQGKAASAECSVLPNATGRALKVNTVTGVWSGINYLAGDMDWSGYKRLVLQVYNPGPAIKLGLRIDDSRSRPSYRQRINVVLSVETGEHQIVLNWEQLYREVASGDFDATRIRQLHLFRYPDAAAAQFYIQKVRLTQ